MNLVQQERAGRLWIDRLQIWVFVPHEDLGVGHLVERPVQHDWLNSFGRLVVELPFHLLEPGQRTTLQVCLWRGHKQTVINETDRRGARLAVMRKSQLTFGPVTIEQVWLVQSHFQVFPVRFLQLGLAPDTAVVPVHGHGRSSGWRIHFVYKRNFVQNALIQHRIFLLEGGLSCLWV